MSGALKMVQINKVAWIVLFLSFFFATFGFWNILYLIFLSLFGLTGFLVAMYPAIQENAREVKKFYSESEYDLPHLPLLKYAAYALGPTVLPKLDRRLTGSYIIDDPLIEMLDLIMHHYVDNWYRLISPSPEFPLALRHTLQHIVIKIANKCKGVAWVPYFTTKLVDDAASHLRLFRQARVKLKQEQDDLIISTDHEEELINSFFEQELAMEKPFCRSRVCTDSDLEMKYLQHITDWLLYVVLPPEDFQNKAARKLIKEIFISYILMPTIDLLSDPDYINQTIIWLCKSFPVTNDGFLTTIKLSGCLDELYATLDKVNLEIARLRSQDSGGLDDQLIKQQLSSLLYVKKLIESRMNRLQEGLDTDSSGYPSQIDWNKLMAPGCKLFSLPLEVVLKNNIALSYFLDFLSSNGAQAYLFLYLNIEGWKVSAEQEISEYLLELEKSKRTSSNKKGTTIVGFDPRLLQQKLDNIKNTARAIYEQYLSEKANPKVGLEESLVKDLLNRIQNESLSDTWFDDIQVSLQEKFQSERFLPSFKNTTSYVRLLAELDLLKDPSKSDDEGDSVSLDDISLSDNVSLSSYDVGLEDSQLPSQELSLHIEIIQTNIVPDGSKPFAVYTLEIHKKDSSGCEESWHVYRRYSDFYDLHQRLVCLYPELGSYHFPGKRPFYNLDKSFLEKRKKALSDYLVMLSSAETWHKYEGILAHVVLFFDQGTYKRGQQISALKRVDSLMKNSVKSVGNAVKGVPDSLKDGLSKVFTSKNKSPVLSESSKVGASLTEEGEDNIPLRILLLLIDEVFDLKSRNMWLRRRIVALLRQIIKAMFGDIYNRKIVEFVEWLISPEQVAMYLHTFKETLWPAGAIAPVQPARDHAVKMRTRVGAKAALLSSLSDEMKHVIGNETTRKGLMCVFDLFQHRTLNKRLIFVLFEGLLQTLFPQNEFNKILEEHHSVVAQSSKNPRGSEDTKSDEGLSISESQLSNSIKVKSGDSLCSLRNLSVEANRSPVKTAKTDVNKAKVKK